MNKVIFAVCLFVMLLGMIACIYKVRQKKGIAVKEVERLLSAGCIAIVVNIAMMLTNSYIYMSVFNSIFFASIDWIMLCFFQYTLTYTEMPQLKEIYWKLLRVVLLLDTFSMCVNPVFEQATDYRRIIIRGELYLKQVIKPLYVVHLAVCYALFAASMIVLIKKAVDSYNFYRVKYVLIILVMCFITVLDASFVFFDEHFNFSVLSFCLGGIVIYVCTFTYIPKKIQDYIFAQVVKLSEEGIILFDINGHCVYINEMGLMYFAQQEGYEQLDEFALKWDITEEDRKKSFKKQLVLKLQEQTIYGTLQYEKFLDKSGRFIGSFFVFHNTSKEELLRRKQEYNEKYDPLTGIYKREFFFNQVKILLELSPDADWVMIASNIERFKLINDIFGIDEGNNLLIAIADILKNVKISEQDCCYGRIESDCFAMFVKKKYYSDGLAHISRLQSMTMKDVNYRIINDFGIYEVEDVTMSPEIMYDRAVLALNTVKGDYNGTVGYYNQNLIDLLLKEQEILHDIEAAISQKQLEIYVQPQINHNTAKIVGAEALIRWNHPERGVISPSLFIPIFEKNGYITRIDQYIWENACQWLQQWREKGYRQCSLSVNISTKDFFYVDIYDVFTKLIEKYNIPAFCLKLEITESAFVMDMKKQLGLVRKLQAAGFSIEMDDFGSGYSSLNSLKSIPVDILKMDMEFLSGQTDAERGKDIIEMVVALAKKLNIMVIAEGVETKEQAEFLSRAGCENMQGYYYAKPMPISEYEQFFKEHEYQDIFMQ